MLRRLSFSLIVFFLLIEASGQHLSDTTLPDLIPYRNGNLWGYCNKNRQLVLPANFLWADPFKNEFAWIRIDSLRDGIIDKKGKIVCEVQKDTVVYVTDSGRIYIEFNNRIISVREVDGIWFSPQKYEVEKRLSDNLYLAKRGNKYGLIDRNEKIIFPFKYRHISYPDESGFFLIEKPNKRKGYVNLKGEKLMPFKSKNYYLESFSEGLALISYGRGYNNLHGFMDRNGKLIIPMIYKKAFSFQNGISEVSDGNRTGFINQRGDTVIQFRYGDVRNYKNGYIGYTTLLYAILLNKKGNEILKVRADYLYYANDSLIVIGKKGVGQLSSLKYGIIDISGKEIWPCDNYSIYCNLYQGLIYVLESWGKQPYYMDYKFNKYYED